MTEDGILLIEAKRYRTQDQNRVDAIQRLILLVRNALVEPKPRRKTRPSIAAKAARLKDKKIRAEIKKIRSNKPGDFE